MFISSAVLNKKPQTARPKTAMPRPKTAMPRPKTAMYQKELIISTGDISDVDGFYALIEYGKSGKDCLFIMNYPGYIDVTESTDNDNDITIDNKTKNDNPDFGLGYKFTSEDIINRDKDKQTGNYEKILKKYGNNLKKAQTAMAKYFCEKIWEESGATGKLYFMIGGVNKIIPFHLKIHKNEVLVYSEQVILEKLSIIINENNIGEIFPLNQKIKDLTNLCNLLKNYTSIYIDFNGSMSFLNDSIYKIFESNKSKIKGVFIMGGILLDKEPATMPFINNTLNRFAAATMNQLYHPEFTGRFFDFIKEIDTFIVPNNNCKFINDPPLYTSDGLENFLINNKLIETLPIENSFIYKLASKFYPNESIGKPPFKPFDYYVGKALVSFIKGELNCTEEGIVYYNNTYGLTFYSENKETDILDKFNKTINSVTIPFKKNNLKIEYDYLLAKNLTFTDFKAKIVNFDIDADKLITINCKPPNFGKRKRNLNIFDKDIKYLKSL
jgi:hypothetical protein